MKKSACQCRKHRVRPLVWEDPQAVDQLSLRAAMTEPVLWVRVAALPSPRASEHVLRSVEATAGSGVYHNQ